MRIKHMIKTDQWRSAPQIRPAPHFVVSQMQGREITCCHVMCIVRAGERNHDRTHGQRTATGQVFLYSPPYAPYYFMMLNVNSKQVKILY